MNDPAPVGSLDALQALLRPARERMTRDVRRAARRQLLSALFRLLVVLGAIEAVGLAIAHLAGFTPRVSFHLVLLAVLIVGAIVDSLRARQFVRRRSPTWQGTAERIDLAVRGHNRIAIALDFAQRDDGSCFSQAAIADGVEQLRGVGEQSIPAPEVPEIRNGPLMTAALAASVAALLFTVMRPAANSPTSMDATPTAQLFAHAATPDERVVPKDNPNPEKPTRRVHRNDMSHEKVVETTPDAATAVANRLTAKPPSTMLAQAAAARSGIQSPNDSAAAAANAAELSESAASKPKSKRPERPRGKTDANPKADDANAQASQSNIASGGAGAGRIKAVEGSNMRHDTPPVEDADTMDESGEIEESNGSGNQRGGIQPSLPDRTAAPSRELGITGPKSKRPGTGRGGPSPPKKSRGAASLLMGVPIPDFVHGKTGPGPVTISIENMQPQPSGAQPGTTSASGKRSLPEAAIERDNVPWTEASTVRRYLQRLRGNDANTPHDTPSASDAGGAATSESQEVPQSIGNDL